MLVPATIDHIRTAAGVLREGGLVAFPTETVYGLGAVATDDRAVARIFAAKGRPSNNPLIVHIPSADDLDSVAVWDTATQKLLEKLIGFWPGPLSIVLPKNKAVSSLVTAGGNYVAVRVPNHPVALSLLREVRTPIAAPSANPSNYLSPTSASHVEHSLGSVVDLILDGGTCRVGLESTVLSLVDSSPTILRPGAITSEMLEEVLGTKVVATKGVPSDQLLSPGMLEKHYSPRTPIRLTDRIDQIPPGARVGYVSFHGRTSPIAEVERREVSDSGDAEQIARKLFGVLHELDQLNLDFIVVDSCERTGIGVAVMDRLERAAR